MFHFRAVIAEVFKYTSTLLPSYAHLAHDGEAPSPDARFPSSKQGWEDATAFANSKPKR